MTIITYFLVFKDQPSNFMYQGYDMNLSVNLAGFSTSSIPVYLHFNVSGGLA